MYSHGVAELTEEQKEALAIASSLDQAHVNNPAHMKARSCLPLPQRIAHNPCTTLTCAVTNSLAKPMHRVTQRSLAQLPVRLA